MEKSGKLTQPESCAEGEDNSPLYWGTVLESVVADHYARKTAKRERRVNAVLQHPNHPWMLANLDRQIVGDGEVQILECKTAGIHGAKLWRNGLPEYVQLKSDFRLSRNFLKGIIGDHINAMMAAAAWNFSLWMRLFLAFLFGFNPRQLNHHPLLGTNRRVIA
jgi:predicted phage-related endonuclease